MSESALFGHLWPIHNATGNRHRVLRGLKLRTPCRRSGGATAGSQVQDRVSQARPLLRRRLRDQCERTQRLLEEGHRPIPQSRGGSARRPRRAEVGVREARVQTHAPIETGSIEARSGRPSRQSQSRSRTLGMGSVDIQQLYAHEDHEPVCSRRRESALIPAFDGARWRGLTSAATEPRFMQR